MGPDVLRGKLRLSAAALGASGGAGARISSRPVMASLWTSTWRNGQPRHPDGAGGQTGDRQAHPDARPRLSHCGSADRWTGRPTEEGTPKGGPLSPLLSNLMLDVLDKELEKRGHRFVRYSEDCNIYLRSQRAETASRAADEPSASKSSGWIEAL
jgi:hypothetical protein